MPVIINRPKSTTIQLHGAIYRQDIERQKRERTVREEIGAHDYHSSSGTLVNRDEDCDVCGKEFDHLLHHKTPQFNAWERQDEPKAEWADQNHEYGAIQDDRSRWTDLSDTAGPQDIVEAYRPAHETWARHGALTPVRIGSTCSIFDRQGLLPAGYPREKKNRTRPSQCSGAYKQWLLTYLRAR
ncbi:hypothetical protein LCGC14_2924540 [marine sediment metagenome]|uniref:Uncharacterized protein n=1 Tax=marine sediment metagenome TaxID=412755 RepID=A0A0F8XMZ8_9ZZZZ